MSASQFENTARAFSKQAVHFDEEEKGNLILQHMRAQVRSHVLRFLKSTDKMLELNCGTGLDAVFFSSHCFEILATDVSDGMIEELKKKIYTLSISNIKPQTVSFTQLNQVEEKNFNYVFSNFGGLNCVDDLSIVAKELLPKLSTGAHITLVIMPPFCLWESLNLFKGNFKLAFRRWKKGGTPSHLEGEFFQTFYFTPGQVLKSFGEKFQLVKIEGLGVFLPQPHQKGFLLNHPRTFSFLKKTDSIYRKIFPFNRWGDHFIITLKYLP